MASLRSAGKYVALQQALATAEGGPVRLRFAEIAGLIGGPLPAGAYRRASWWANTASFQVRAWRTVGWRVQHANLADQTVTFVWLVGNG